MKQLLQKITSMIIAGITAAGLFIGALPVSAAISYPETVALSYTAAPATNPTTPSLICPTIASGTREPGFYGQYYNLSSDDPGMVRSRGESVSNAVVGGANYWYSPEYFTFGRIDPNLKFGNSFFPIKSGKKGDPYYFAVHWRAVMVVPSNGSYNLSMTSDDDGWLLIDNNLAIDLGGLHRAQTKKATVTLTSGEHIVDIYYAERGGGRAVFTFLPDSTLNFYAAPNGCTANKPTIGKAPSGRVLGDSTSALGYTPAVALYKTANSPAIYAIYANGLKHYISSPEAFHRYGYRFTEVRTVTQATLDRYPEARLVRTPENPKIYFLSPRSNKQWLKIPLNSGTVFASYDQNHWGHVIVIDELDINAYPNTVLIRQRGDSQIYLLQNDVRRPFVSDAIMEQLGYNRFEALEISPVHMESFRLGDPIG